MARYIDADLLRNEMEELYEHHLEMKIFCADGAVSDCLYFLDNAPTADVVEVEVLRDWLWEIALNNVGEDLSRACQDIISRFDGLRNFAKERSTMRQVKLTDNKRTILRSDRHKCR